jgi:hypothetical protein
MVDVKVLLWKTHGIVGWAIKRVTQMPWGHAAMYLVPADLTVERTIWWNGIWFKTGVRVTDGRAKCQEVRRPRVPLSYDEYHEILKYWLGELNLRRPYNIAKLLVKAIVIPARRFFDRLGWIPFDDPVLGDDCSSTVAEAFKAAGRTIPDMPTGRVAPGDFRETNELMLEEEL